MPLLIDTYNVLHTTGVLPPEMAGIEVDGLIELIKTSRYRDQSAILACDGAPSPGEKAVQRIGNFTIRYSGKGKPADDLIAALVKASTAPRSLIVVSSDHEVQKHARKRRCRIMTSDEFLRELADDANLAPAAQPQKPPSGMTEAQIERWIKAFKIDEQTLLLQTRSRLKSPLPPPPAENESVTESAAPPHQIKHLAKGEGLPEDFIEEAERIWAQENAKSRPIRNSEPENKHP